MSSISPVQTPVTAQTKRDFYVLVGILALIGVGLTFATVYSCIISPRPDNTPAWAVAILSSVMFVAPNLVALCIMSRLRLLADERGLQVRGAFVTQFIPWRDIEDYELRPALQAATACRAWICAQGKWQRLPRILDNMEELRARIQTQATESRAQAWQLNVERDNTENWPKIYAYHDPSGGKMFALVVVGLLFICALVIDNSFGPSSATANSNGGALQKWVTISAILLPLLLIHYAIFRSKKRLGARAIRADSAALCWLDGDTQTRIAWHEITEYFLEDASGPVTLHQCVVESPRARIVFRQEIANYTELKALIRARAVNAASREWKHRESTDKDILGGAASLWSGGVAGVGRKVHHYRTRTARAMLFLGSFFSLIFLVGYSSSLRWHTPEISDFVAGVLFFLPTLMLTVGGALAFWRASIQTDKNGITHRNIRGERTLNWSEIESFAFNGYFYTVEGKSTTIRYWLVAASESLQAEIEARTELKMRRTDRSEGEG